MGGCIRHEVVGLWDAEELAKLGLLHLGCNRDVWGHNYHFARLRMPCNVQQVRH